MSLSARPAAELPTDVVGTYLWFARAFDYPDPEIWDGLESPEGPVPPRTQADREAEFLAAFEFGGEAPPVSPYEGFARPTDGREGILEDVLRFYGYFEVRLREDNRDYPDHLVTELEFLAFLTGRETEAVAHRADPEGYRRAARDFLDRHLLVWLPMFVERLDPTGTVYGPLGRELLAFVQAHRAALSRGPEGDER